ncbi:MAG: hypothetical protein MHPSP_002758 [Paramarteilia canceri]
MAKCCNNQITGYISGAVMVISKIIAIATILLILASVLQQEKPIPICPYKITGSEECKCGSMNGQTVTTDSGKQYCYSSDCAETINTCNVKMGSKLTYKSGDDCPTCREKCEAVRKTKDCICDDERKDMKIGETDYCFSSECDTIIENCDLDNGYKLTYVSGNCPTCLKKCETGLINNNCICDGKTEMKEHNGQNYCVGINCENPEECKGEITFDEKSQCLICSDDEVTPKTSSAQNAGIVVGVIAVILLLIVAIIFLFINSNKDREIVALAQPDDHRNNPDFLVNNDDYNIVPISVERD